MEHLIKLAMDWSEVTLLNSLATACLHRTEALGWQRFINKVQKEPDNSKKKRFVQFILVNRNGFHFLHFFDEC